MHFTTSVAVLVAAAAITAANPAPPAAKLAFAVDQVDRGKTFKAGPIAAMKAYEKFARDGASAPSYVRAAAAAAQKGSVKAVPEQFDSQYLSPVRLGQQTLMLDFDTGSSDLWAFSTLQPTAQSQGHTTYKPNQSGTKLDGYTWQIKYGDGSGAAGLVYVDRVKVGPVTATSQAVEAATSVSASFVSNVNNDGLLGLGFPNINTVQPEKQSPFFDTVKPTLASPVFTADLQKGKPGSYTFGFIDKTKYTGPITFVPVNSTRGYWLFTAGGYSVGDSGTTSGSIGTAIADTGTTLLYLPPAVAQAYYNQVSGAVLSMNQGGYVFPCKAKLPDLNLELGGTVFTVPGSYLNFAPINSAGKRCYGGLQPDTGLPFSIYGDIFLKSIYAIFDQRQSTPRLGIAKQS